MDDNEKPRFRALPSPTRAEIAAVAWQTCEETVALLRQRGQWIDASPEEADRLAQDEPLLAACYSASLLGTIATGPGAGRRLMRLYGAAARDPDDEKPPKNAYGFDVHAGVRTPARDRKRLERLLRYQLRPALSNERLEQLSDGQYAVRLKRPYSDGTTHIVMDGPTLIERLVALIPRPRMNLVRYFGVFAPRSRLRSAVIPEPPEQECCGPDTTNAEAAADGSPHAKNRRTDWARLLKRVFDVDVLRLRLSPVLWALRASS